MLEIVGWALGRTAWIPKFQRFTFRQRLDGLALDAFQAVVRAIFAGDARRKQEALAEFLPALEQMQALGGLAAWREPE